mgnify:CR=1 FL=1
MCLVYHTLFADETTPTPKSDAHLYGHVIDSKTGEHLPYATVTIPGTTIGTMTDASGHYFLKNLPTGTITVEARMMSYDPVRHEVTLKKGQSLELNFEITENGITMDDVVVSASRSETTRRKAPALVNVLDRKIFDNTNSACLAQGLGFQPGVRVEDDCQNCGFMQVRINGLDGHYSQILVDSHPVFSALSGVYGLEQIPASMIDRVEVMRGGGSALFGSSAIGGTINIITKDPDRNSAEVGHTITAIGNSSSYDNVTSANASLVTDSRKAGLYVYGQNRHRSGYDHDGDGFTEIPQLQSQSLGLRSFFKTSAYSRITLQYNTVMEYRRGGDRLDLPPHEAMIAEQTDHNINGGSLSFDLSSADFSNRVNVYASFQHIARKSYYGSKQDPDAYGRTHDLTVATGAQYIHSFDRLWFLPADLTLGVEYNYNDLDDESIGYDYRTKQKVHIIGAYLQNEWKNEHWSLLIGGRLDKHSLVDHVIFSPRANLRYNPGEGASLRLSYSSGFRAPQAFDEDLHVENVGGNVAMVELADNLKEERSQSLSASADIYHRFGAFQVNFLVEGFYTKLSDVFALTDGEVVDGILTRTRYNAPGARVMGLTLEGKMAYAWLQLQAGATIQRSRYKEAVTWSETNPDLPAQKKMFRTPDVYGYFTSTFTPVKRLAVSLTGTYTGTMLVQHLAGYIPEDREEKTPDFFDLNMKVAYDFPLYKSVTLQLNAGVQNIFEAYQSDFDQDKDRDSKYIYGPGMPRSYFVGCKISY